MSDETYLDENIRIPQENDLPRTKVGSQAGAKPQILIPGPIHKFYIAQVFAALAFMIGLASIASYAVSQGYVEPSHFQPYISLWWGLLYLFSIVNLFFVPTTQRWKVGKFQVSPTSTEKWVYVTLFFSLFRNIITKPFCISRIVSIHTIRT